MDEIPYRPAPSFAEAEAEAELARLAARGQRRIDEVRSKRVAAQQMADAWSKDRNVRAALGAHYGAPIWKLSYGLMGVVVLGSVACFVWDSSLLSTLAGPIIGAFIGTVFLRLFTRPIATRARVAAEARWVGSLPFVMDGYFEALATEPPVACQILIELTWMQPERAPDPKTLQGLLGLFDTGSQAESPTKLRSGDVRCDTVYSRSSGDSTHVPNSTHRVVAYVHQLVGMALLQLHRSHPLERVCLTRDDNPAIESRYLP